MFRRIFNLIWVAYYGKKYKLPYKLVTLGWCRELDFDDRYQINLLKSPGVVQYSIGPFKWVRSRPPVIVTFREAGIRGIHDDITYTFNGNPLNVKIEIYNSTRYIVSDLQGI